METQEIATENIQNAIKVPCSLFPQEPRFSNHIQMLMINDGVFLEFRAAIPEPGSLPKGMNGEQLVGMDMDISNLAPHTRIYLPLQHALELRELLNRTFQPK